MQRLAESVARLCAVLPVKQVARFFGLGWDAEKAIDKRHLAVRLETLDLSRATTIAMDEFAIQKGHPYAMLVVEPACKRVIRVGRCRSREAVRPSLRCLEPFPISLHRSPRWRGSLRMPGQLPYHEVPRQVSRMWKSHVHDSPHTNPERSTAS
jgi:hypothetical protein